MELPHETFVVVADGQKMLFFRNEGDSKYPKLELVRGVELDNPADRDIKSDREGRTQESMGGRRSGYEETDFHQLAEDRFAAEAADLLKERALRGDFARLIVVAPPYALGEMRKHYHGAVEERLIGEIDKDLTNHPVEEIEQIILAS